MVRSPAGFEQYLNYPIKPPGSGAQTGKTFKFAAFMMKHRPSDLPRYLTIFLFVVAALQHSSCANILPPGGGPRDSLPPVLVSSTPRDSALHVSSNRIVLNFDEYVDLDPSAQQNIIVAPNPKVQPVIDHHLRTVTIRLRDSLVPNTTYSIHFGNAVRDVNEGNILKDFTYIFSTGDRIDEGTLSGQVVLAENGKTDSTLLVGLYRNLDDSAVIKSPPYYYTNLDGSGHYHFTHLAPGRYAVYALPNDYAKRYDDSTKLFAFCDSVIDISAQPQVLDLFAYQEARKTIRVQGSAARGGGSRAGINDKRLTYSTNGAGNLDLLQPLVLSFNRPLKVTDTNSIRITDTAFGVQQRPQFRLDSTGRILAIVYPWQENANYRLILPKNAVADSTGLTLSKTDTLPIHTKRESEYGSIRLRFTHVNLDRHPVIQLWSGEKMVESFALRSLEWYRKLYVPGSFDIRLLYDTNGNGVWDPGHFPSPKKQPEVVLLLQKELIIRSNWDNEYDINIKDASAP